MAHMTRTSLSLIHARIEALSAMELSQMVVPWMFSVVPCETWSTLFRATIL